MPFRLGHIPRNVHFLDGNDDEVFGFFQNGSVTWDEIREWLDDLLLLLPQMPSDSYCIWTCPDDHVLAQHALHATRVDMLSSHMNEIVRAGFYAILSPEGSKVELQVTADQAMPRVVSLANSSGDRNEMAFRERVRHRDLRCVVSGRPVRAGLFDRFHAAHIFPVPQLDVWRSGGWSALLEDDDFPGKTGIHSIQNGILLDASVYIEFEKYHVAVDPDSITISLTT
ncbi:hypothetical protein L228DRAFT_263455 [Xylona heveae TC161]|uniref:HNH nuclease domain-containing protein n=1 Tax=Xylona heveae (strain CBS 132557 / TC161) TaxID=1328760 RepID=A0A164ZVE3_XYLHT|nr:hypothetical protein L228DRAFT_263455 [Xylona heveae TC161]KZF19582.1 hypothetical protein L228DRAFT_263455 [Xylona heveae TC161]